jgi:hypothetical protein
VDRVEGTRILEDVGDVELGEDAQNSNVWWVDNFFLQRSKCPKN